MNAEREIRLRTTQRRMLRWMLGSKWISKSTEIERKKRKSRSKRVVTSHVFYKNVSNGMEKSKSVILDMKIDVKQENSQEGKKNSKKEEDYYLTESFSFSASYVQCFY